jgi:hypothetical protein
MTSLSAFGTSHLRRRGHDTVGFSGFVPSTPPAVAAHFPGFRPGCQYTEPVTGPRCVRRTALFPALSTVLPAGDSSSVDKQPIRSAGVALDTTLARLSRHRPARPRFGTSTASASYVDQSTSTARGLTALPYPSRRRRDLLSRRHQPTASRWMSSGDTFDGRSHSSRSLGTITGRPDRPSGTEPGERS